MLPSLPFKENFTSGRQLIPGQRINSLTSLLTSAAQVVALAGGGAANAPVLNAAFVDITVCATLNDSVVLPPAQVGLRINVTNDGVANASIFPSGNESIQSAGAGVSVPLIAGTNAEFVCTKQGVWKRYVSA